MKRNNIREGSVWRKWAFWIVSTTMLWNVLNLFSKFNVRFDPSNVEECHHLKLTNNVPQKVFVELSKRKDVDLVLKAKPSPKNFDVNETGLPPARPTFVNQSLCRYYFMEETLVE